MVILSALGADDPGSNPGSLTFKKMTNKKTKSAGRYGSRYGRKKRSKVASVESKQKGWHKCPYCNKDRVKRVSTGIWQCRKCNTKFAGGAYTPK